MRPRPPHGKPPRRNQPHVHGTRPRRDGGRAQVGAPRADERILVAPGHRLVMGRNVVRLILDAQPERLVTLYVADAAGESAERRAVLEQTQSLRCAVKIVAQDELTRIVGSDSHQGFVACVKERHILELRDLIERLREKEEGLVLCLDTIHDPQNFGAILRAAECEGVSGVVWSRNRGSDLTPAVSKASVGASELVPLCRVSNLHDAIIKLKESGFWIVAAAVDPTAVSIRDFDFPKKTVILMGSEGEGLQPLLLKESEFKVYIPMQGKIDSLNVSQATAVFLDGYRRSFKGGTVPHSTQSRT